AAAAPAAPASGLGPVAWERLTRALPGSWSMPGKSGPFVVSYKVISGQSALVEEWGVGTKSETETVFAPDHAELLLTHYCAQGNQPRLRVTDVSPEAIVFRFVDVTNRMPDQDMLVERTLRIARDSFDDTEVYRTADGHDAATTYHFTRR
ncbi:MAG TPA: hypothetical protein VIY73_28450, partial [Polyangiaceae bacterium]